MALKLSSLADNLEISLHGLPLQMLVLVLLQLPAETLGHICGCLRHLTYLC